MSNQSVESLLDDLRLLGTEQIKTVEAVRALVRAVIPGVSEQVKYGGILFSLNSGRFFAGVFAYKAHVSVEFSHGAQMADEWGHLEGKGKFRRHIKLASAADLDHKHLEAYLPLALNAAEAAGNQETSE